MTTAHDNPAFLPHPYAAFLDQVLKPARYTGAEVGAVHKRWDAVEATVCLAFPDVYDIGMSHLGLRILYRILNDDQRMLAERAYCPWVDLEAQLRRRQLPLVSLESGRPLCDFDVVGFSLQYELTFTNVLTMLDLGRIPLRSADRGEDDPLVLAGGPGATHPEPLAPFIDGFVIGDGEEKLTEIARCWTALRRAAKRRSERLRLLALLGAVYVPSLYEVREEPATGLLVVSEPADPAVPFPIVRAQVDLSRRPFPDDGPTGGPEAVFDRASIEIARGCTEGCRFCQGGMIYRPARERDPQQLVETVLSAVRKSGCDEVSLTALSPADVSFISPLIERLSPVLGEQRVSLCVSSLRAYGLDQRQLQDLRRMRAGGLTFAPEAGTQRMRNVVNKNISEEQLLETAERAFLCGFKRLKLYFMIGLPGERDEDVAGIAETGLRTARIGRRVGQGRADVTVSVSTHVPKPHTPLQWAEMASLAEIERKHADLCRLLRGSRVKLKTHDAPSTELEAILARGDRRLAAAIEHAWRAGARFDSWTELLQPKLWHEAFWHCGIDPERYRQPLPETATLPWSHIDVGVSQEFLRREHRRALQAKVTRPCSKEVGSSTHQATAAEAAGAERRLICYDCGVACDLPRLQQQRRQRLEQLGSPQTPAGQAPADRPAAGPHKGDPSAGFRYRLRFAKLGPAALLGHLDLVRELPRVLRRLGLSMMYTGGYHPKPAMTFSPALSLGVLSLDERVDLRLSEAFDEGRLSELAAELNTVSPPGLRFLSARRLYDADRRISKLVTGASYVIGLPRAALLPLLPAGSPSVEAWLSERCQAVLAQASILRPRAHRGREKLVDVRAFINDLAVAGAAGAEALQRAGVQGDLIGLQAELAITPEGSARCGEVVAALCEASEPPPHRAVRVQLRTAR